MARLSDYICRAPVERADDETPQHIARAIAGGSETILVVEDDDNLREGGATPPAGPGLSDNCRSQRRRSARNH